MRKTIIIIVMIIIRTIMTKIVIKHQEKYNDIITKRVVPRIVTITSTVFGFFFLTSADDTDNKFVWNP